MMVLDLDRELFKKYTKEEQVLLVDYWAPWCVYCRRIAPVYEKLAEQYQGKILFGKIDVDQQPELAEEQQIEVLPTFVLYKGEQVLGSIVAPESKSKLEAFIQETLT